MFIGIYFIIGFMIANIRAVRSKGIQARTDQVVSLFFLDFLIWPVTLLFYGMDYLWVIVDKWIKFLKKVFKK